VGPVFFLLLLFSARGWMRCYPIYDTCYMRRFGCTRSGALDWSRLGCALFCGALYMMHLRWASAAVWGGGVHTWAWHAGAMAPLGDRAQMDAGQCSCGMASRTGEVGFWSPRKETPRGPPAGRALHCSAGPTRKWDGGGGCYGESRNAYVCIEIRPR
jgi:hypothetical protein